MPEHTPLPWRISRIASTCIEDENGRTVASCGGYQSHPEDSNPENQANTHLIVRAVNSHAELVKACETALSFLSGKHEKRISNQAEQIEFLEQALARAKEQS